jgi:hypothetical protein
LWALDVEEGTGAKPEGRTWKPSLRDIAIAAIRDIFSHEEKLEKRKVVTFQRHRGRVLEALQSTPEGDTARHLRHKLGVTCACVNAVLSELLDAGEIERAVIERRDRVENGYRLVRGG